MAFDFTDMVTKAVKEFSGRIGQYAGADVRKKVMLGVENMPGITDPVKGAYDYKLAVERLEKLVDKPTCSRIMMACGCTCQTAFDQGAQKQKESRRSYATEAEFIANLKSEDPNTVYEVKDGNIIQRFTPGTVVKGLRCACMLIGRLPEGVYASPAVCECSRGFTKNRWETILGRPVKVELVSTPIINDTDECKFIIRL
jgi:hypothetical protein